MSEHPIQKTPVEEQLPAEAPAQPMENAPAAQPATPAQEPAPVLDAAVEANAAEESPTQENIAEENPAEESPVPENDTPAQDATVVDVNAAAPAYAARPLRRKNPARKWGILIGLSLGCLCLACLVLGGGILRAATTGVQIGAGPAPGPAAPADPPAQSETHLQVYDVPQQDGSYTTQYIVEQVRDSVVGILTYDGTSIESAGGGTGIIMSEDGYIVTNAHVVVNTVGLTVVLNDESRYTAKVVGYDEKTDLAVIKINASGLTPAQFGNSDQVAVGERAIAIGNPGGLTGSVSQGIISATNREITITLSDGTGATIVALQTDAAINPGNSGGPLLNAWGQVIGINSSKIVKNGYEGLGFAIPVNQAQPIIDNLIQYGYVKDRAVLGITIIALDAINGPANGLPSQGLYIASVAEYSDLARLGIMAGDVILEANGVEMVSTEDLAAQLAQFRPGDTITMKILQSYDGDIVTLDVLLLDSRAAG